MTRRERLARAGEFVALFGATPVALRLASARGAHVPVLPLLLVAGGAALAYLVRTAPEQLRPALRVPLPRAEVARLALQAAAAAALIAFVVLRAHPERFLELPREHPLVWAAVLVLYPPLSALPQELLFRAFLFQRYADLFGGRGALVVASGLAFGLAHLFFGHWLTLALATLGGLSLAWTFARTRSLPLVVLEHSLYGLLVFTLGLGRHFYAGLP